MHAVPVAQNVLKYRGITIIVIATSRVSTLIQIPSILFILYGVEVPNNNGEDFLSGLDVITHFVCRVFPISMAIRIKVDTEDVKFAYVAAKS